MRYHHLRFDIWLSLALAFVVSLGAEAVMDIIMPKAYESYEEEHIVVDGSIGGKAGDEVYRAQNVEDLLTHDTFTVESPGIEYRNEGAGFYGGRYMYSLKLPSGERVAASINDDSVQSMGESIFDGINIMPVGRVVFEDLTQDEGFLNQIEMGEKLTRTDFYVDMVGEALKMNEEDFTEVPTILVQLLTIIVCFPLFHALGAKLGVFPYFFPPKKQKKSEWK